LPHPVDLFYVHDGVGPYRSYTQTVGSDCDYQNTNYMAQQGAGL